MRYQGKIKANNEVKGRPRQEKTGKHDRPYITPTWHPSGANANKMKKKKRTLINVSYHGAGF